MACASFSETGPERASSYWACARRQIIVVDNLFLYDYSFMKTKEVTCLNPYFISHCQRFFSRL